MPATMLNDRLRAFKADDSVYIVCWSKARIQTPFTETRYFSITFHLRVRIATPFDNASGLCHSRMHSMKQDFSGLQYLYFVM